MVNMNNSEILAKVFELRDMFVNSELYNELKINESKMLEDEETLKLLYLFQNVQTKYNEAKRFENYGSDVASVAEELSNIKKMVDSNGFVSSYNESYKKVKKELKEIEEILFKDIIIVVKLLKT